MGFSLILRAFFSFPNERQFIECQFFWEFRVNFQIVQPGKDALLGDTQAPCQNCEKQAVVGFQDISQQIPDEVHHLLIVAGLERLI